MLKIVIIFYTLTFLLTMQVFATDLSSPIGTWKTIDDKTKKDKSIVKIWIENDKLTGTILKVFPEPGKDPNPICSKCSGEKKDQKIQGMTFMWDFVKNENGNKWTEGNILDPGDGKTYHCEITLSQDGKTIDVYGYIRLLFKIGRHQTWKRVEGS